MSNDQNGQPTPNVVKMPRESRGRTAAKSSDARALLNAKQGKLEELEAKQRDAINRHQALSQNLAGIADEINAYQVQILEVRGAVNALLQVLGESEPVK